MDNKLIKEIDNVIKKSFDYLSIIQTHYGFQSIYLTIYPSTYTNDDIKFHISNANAPSGVMFNVAGVSGIKEITNTEGNKECIITDISGILYMPYEKLYQLIIECRMDFNDVLESMYFTIRHELGHIVFLRDTYVGKPLREWNNDAESKFKTSYDGFPKLRKNASYQSRLNFYLKYNLEIPIEKAANDAVGITADDIINNFKRICRK